MTKPATYAYLDDELRADALRIERKAPEARTENESRCLAILARLNDNQAAIRKSKAAIRESKAAIRESKARLRGSQQKFTVEVRDFLRQIREQARHDLARAGWILDDDQKWRLNGAIQDAGPDLPQAKILLWEHPIDTAFELGYAEIAFGFGIETAALLIAPGYKPYLDRLVSMMQSARAKKNRRPRFPTLRPIRCALAKGKESAAEVVAFLEGTPEIRDEWGLMHITDAGDQFIVEDLDGPKDDDEYPEGIIPKSGNQLSVLVSKAKKTK